MFHTYIQSSQTNIKPLLNTLNGNHLSKHRHLDLRQAFQLICIVGGNCQHSQGRPKYNADHPRVDI